MKKFFSTALAGILFVMAIISYQIPAWADSTVTASVRLSMNGKEVSAAKPGDVIDVMLYISGYDDQEIDASLIKAFVPIDEEKFEYVQDSLKNESTMSEVQGIFILNYSLLNKCVQFQFSAWSSAIINKDTKNLCSFQVKVKDALDKDVQSKWDVNPFAMNKDAKPEPIYLPTKSESCSLDIIAQKPVVLLNDYEPAGNNYNDSVTIKVDKGNVVLSQGDVETDITESAKSDEGYRVDKNGTYTVTATDKVGNQTSIMFQIDLDVESIEMKALPVKLTYTEGKTNTIDPTGGIVGINYKNGTEDIVELTLNMCSGYNLQEIGTSTIIVTYSGKTTEFQVDIVEKEPIGISLDSMPSVVEYPQGTYFKVDGAKIKVIYDNGTSEIIDVVDSMIKKMPDMEKTGAQTIEISYLGFSEQFQIIVLEKKVVDIKLVSTPSNATAIEGMLPDLSGGIINVIYDNNTSEKINMTVSMIENYDKNRIGEQEISIVYGGHSITISVTVLEKSLQKLEWVTKPDKLQYLQGQELDLQGIKVKAIYNNKTEQILTEDELEIEDFDSDQIGKQKIVLLFEDKSISFFVTVLTRANIEKLQMALEQIELSDLTAADEWNIIDLDEQYKKLSKMEKEEISLEEQEKLEEAVRLMKELIITEYPEYGITIEPELGAIPRNCQIVASASDASISELESLLKKQNVYGKSIKVQDVFNLSIAGRKNRNTTGLLGDVKIKVDKGDEQKLKVVRFNLDAQRATDSNAKDAGDYIVFSLKELGDYAIVEVIQDNPNPPKPPVEKPDRESSDDDDSDEIYSGQWLKNNIGWWYKNVNGTYTVNDWQKIQGVWYLFDEKGYMKSGWQKVADRWYYLDESGAMKTGWIRMENGDWYFMNADGAMAQGWLWYQNSWYFLMENGIMAKDTIIDGDQINSSGVWEN